MVYERCTAVPSREDDLDTMPIPLTDYGLSKLVCERLCEAFSKQYGLRATIWRPFNIITPHERGEAESGLAHVFADLIQKIVVAKQNPIEIFGDGQQVRCFTWIEDVASAIAQYSFDPLTDGQVYNLGNPEPVTIRELACKIHKAAVREGVVRAEVELGFAHRPAFDDDVRIRIPSIDKARTELGWTPTVSLAEALEACVREALTERTAAEAARQVQ